MLTRRAKAYSS